MPIRPRGGSGARAIADSGTLGKRMPAAQGAISTVARWQKRAADNNWVTFPPMVFSMAQRDERAYSSMIGESTVAPWFQRLS